MCVCVCVYIYIYIYIDTVQLCIFFSFLFFFSPKIKQTKYVIPVEHRVLEKGIPFIKIIRNISDNGKHVFNVPFATSCLRPSSVSEGS